MEPDGWSVSCEGRRRNLSLKSPSKARIGVGSSADQDSASDPRRSAAPQPGRLERRTLQTWKRETGASLSPRHWAYPVRAGLAGPLVCAPDRRPWRPAVYQYHHLPVPPSPPRKCHFWAQNRCANIARGRRQVGTRCCSRRVCSPTARLALRDKRRNLNAHTISPIPIDQSEPIMQAPCLEEGTPAPANALHRKPTSEESASW